MSKSGLLEGEKQTYCKGLTSFLSSSEFIMREKTTTHTAASWGRSGPGSVLLQEH